MEEMRNACEVLVGKPDWDYSENLDVDGSIILECI